MMTDCIFCKIIAGEIPSYKVYEDEDFIVILDIFPINPGHTLIIPKKHIRWVWDYDQPGKYFELTNNIANASRRALGTEYLTCGIAGTDVSHAHIHLVPRFEGDGLGEWMGSGERKKLPKEQMDQILEKIKNALVV